MGLENGRYIFALTPQGIRLVIVVIWMALCAEFRTLLETVGC